MKWDRFLPKWKYQAFEGQSRLGLAAPQDRMAAYVLDSTLLLPLVQLLQSPVKRWIFESLTIDAQADVSFYRSLNLAIFVVLFILYYTLMIFLKGQTLGKMFFGIKVISYHGRITFYQSFLRSFTIFFEFLFLGFPFLEIFSHPMRRPAHDRIADTLVISLHKPVSFPSLIEQKKVRIFAFASAFVFLLFASIYVFSPVDSEKAMARLKDEKTCKEKLEEIDSDLSTSIELFLVAKISDRCLYENAREQLWGIDNSHTLPMFAIALSLFEQKEESDSYLKKICDENASSRHCLLSRWLQDEKRGERQNIQSFFDEVKRHKESERFIYLLIASYAANRDYDDLLFASLKKMGEPGVLKPYVVALTFQGLLTQLKWDEAYWLFQVNSEVNSRNLAWFVGQQMQNGKGQPKEHLQLLELFYPQLKETSMGRQPASLQQVPGEIKELHGYLEGVL